MTLFPRFSVRLLLVLTSAFALLFLLVNLAQSGSDAAASLVIVVVATALLFLLYAAFFMLAYGLARITRQIHSRDHATSPFATDKLPPQVISPRKGD